MSKKDDSSLLIGVFYDREHAERAFHELQQEGFGVGQLSMALLDQEETVEVPPRPRTKAGVGAAVGLLVGGILSSFLGVLATAWLSILGQRVALGPILLGALAAGLVLGGLFGALIGWSVRPNLRGPMVARDHLSRGIVTVRAQHRYEQAAAILRRHAGCEADSASTAETAR